MKFASLFLLIALSFAAASCEDAPENSTEPQARNLAAPAPTAPGDPSAQEPAEVQPADDVTPEGCGCGGHMGPGGGGGHKGPGAGCGHMGPPAEAVAACENKTAGETCSFVLNGDAVASTCSLRRNGEGPLACRAGLARNADGSFRGPGSCSGHDGQTCDHGADGKSCGCMGPGMAACNHAADGKSCGCLGAGMAACDHGADGTSCGCMNAGRACDHGADGESCGCLHDAGHMGPPAAE